MEILSLINLLGIDKTIFSGVLAGGVGASLVGFVLFQLKNIPLYIYNLIRKTVSYNFTIYDYSIGYEEVEKFIYEHKKKTDIKNFSVNRNREIISGYGSYFIFDGFTPIIVRKYIDQEAKKISGIQNVISMTAITLNKNKFMKLISSMIKKARDKVSIQTPGYDGFSEKCKKEKRSIETVYLPSSIKDDIVSDIKKFYDSKKRYTDLGIPWRRGYLFHGKPGIGKSSLIFALASEFSKNIKFVIKNNISKDNDLIDLFSEAEEDDFLVLEDFDKSDGDDSKKISESCILNAIDGVVAGEGRILFITANDITQINPAIFRNGRIDRIFEFPLCDYEIASKMYDSIIGDKNKKNSIMKKLELILPCAHATVQEKLMELYE